MPPIPLRSLHRASAVVLVTFAVVHVANHLASLHGVDAHVSVMGALRGVYRHPIVEPVLLLCVLMQVVSGLRLVVRGWSSRAGRVAWLQAGSGMVLAFFLVIHVSAVLVGRAVLGLDTNFHFAAAGFHVSPYVWFFAPYYTLAVFALFAHLGCAFYWTSHASALGRAKAGLAIALVTGAVASTAISLSLAGKIQPVSVPEAYKAPYTAP